VDISRILTAATNVVKQGGLGNSIADLPAAGAAPEWMSEKAVSIGFYVIASGVYTVLGTNLPVLGSKRLTDYVCGDIEKTFGGRFEFEPDPIKAARLMIAHMDRKRAALKLAPVMYAPRETGVPAAVSAT
jgi:carbon-monoxide dehydrogenase catalytic subunit